MSKLSPSLKALVNAPFARAGPVGAPRGVREVYEGISREAARQKLGTRPWLAMAAAATMTLNSPDSLTVLHGVASAQGDATQTAELIREVGLKCISFNGIPRSINCLNGFRAALDAAGGVSAGLATAPTRTPTAETLDAVGARGRRLWDSVYAPFADKLVDKLARAHPDLPVHILNSHYGPLLSDPDEGGAGPAPGRPARTGRVLTSVVALACLRAQTGVGPQVLSHVYGLRKAYEDGTWRDGDAEGEEVVRWLAGDEGNGWILRSVDKIVEALGGSNFARPSTAAKL